MIQGSRQNISPDYPGRIKRLRAELGLTQVRLAELMGVSFASVNRWENGQSRPSPLAWQQILRAEQRGAEALGPDYAGEPEVRESDAVYNGRSSAIDFATDPGITQMEGEGRHLSRDEAATITELSSWLLIPGVLPELWRNTQIKLGELYQYFSGNHVVEKGGYEKPITIPRAEPPVIDAAVRAAVKDGRLWLTSGTSSIYAEEIPADMLTESAVFQAPPQPIDPTDILPAKLPEVWTGDTTSAIAISVALSKKAGKALPWTIVREAIDEAIQARILERTPDSGSWPCDRTGAQAVELRLSAEQISPPLPDESPKSQPCILVAELQSNEVQDLAYQIGAITELASGLELKFHIQIKLVGSNVPSKLQLAKIGDILESIAKDVSLFIVITIATDEHGRQIVAEKEGTTITCRKLVSKCKVLLSS